MNQQYLEAPATAGKRKTKKMRQERQCSCCFGLVRTLTFLQTQSENFKAFAIDRDLIFKNPKIKREGEEETKSPPKNSSQLDS
jgi:hypothetical protein